MLIVPFYAQKVKVYHVLVSLRPSNMDIGVEVMRIGLLGKFHPHPPTNSGLEGLSHSRSEQFASIK